MRQELITRYYYDKPDFVDGTTEFHSYIARSVAKGSRILEVGAGPTNETSKMLASIGPVSGLDVSEEVRRNASLVDAFVFNGGRFPLKDRTFDACVSNYVLEHVADPELHFAEVARVLRPGGAYLFRTPNLHHYISLFSRLTPHWVHELLANRMRGQSDAHAPYPTFYKANTQYRLSRLGGRGGFETELLIIEKEPFYAPNALFFYPMMWYERVVNSSDVFAGVRANIIGRLTKNS